MIKELINGEYMGFDIDGCMNNIEEFMYSRMFEFARKYGKINHITPYKYYISDIFGTPKEDNIIFWRNHALELLEDLEPRFYVREGLEYVKKYGKKIWIVTSRSINQLHSYETKTIEELTEKFLKKYNIPFDKITYGINNKASFCKSNSIISMMEDQPKNIIELVNNKIPVFIFNNFCNLGVEKTLDVDYISRIYSWQHFVYEFERIIGKE